MKTAKSLLLIGPLVAILAVSAWLSYAMWISVEGPPMPLLGHLAMWLGIVFSLLVGCGLMALMFYSSRRGYDEAAQRESDKHGA